MNSICIIKSIKSRLDDFMSRYEHKRRGISIAGLHLKEDIELQMDSDTRLIRQMHEVMTQAIRSGDWKIDGSCDPDALLNLAEQRIKGVAA